MQDFVSILSNFGFPVALSIYLLTRFEKKLEVLTDKIDNLSSAIKDLKMEVRELKNDRRN